MNQLIVEWKKFWRLAEMRLLFLALLVAVVAVTSVGFFTDRADRAMSQQATTMLGGDMVVVSTRPISDTFLQEAEKRGLRTAETISFPSMVSVGEKFQLAQIKAVSVEYPLHGNIETSESALGEVENTLLKRLEKDEVLAESRLFVALNIKAGQEVQLGQSKVRLAKLIRKMPDQSASIFQLAPKLILPMHQLKATGLLTPASRARYSQLFAGDEKNIKQFTNWLKPQLKKTEAIRTLEDGLPSVQQALQRGQRFLKMASLLAVILAGAGIALSSYSLTQHETPAVAVLKTMGASRRQILFRYLSQLFFSATIAALVGAILGYIIQLFLASYLQDFVGQTLPSASWWPVVVGLFTAWIMVLGFSVPHLMRLINTSPVQILQGQSSQPKTSLFFSAFVLSAAVLLLMWMQTQDIKLSGILLIAVLVAIAVFWLMATLMLRVIRKLGERWRLPKANKRMALMVVVFGIGLFSLLLLTTLRGDLINRWQASLPVSAPNHFLINIQPDEVEPLQKLLSKDKIETPLYPMVLGRLVKINDKAVSEDDYETDRAKRLLIREFNMSANVAMPEGNKIVSGDWFKPEALNGLSVEEGIAKTLRLKMGDSMTFDIAGEQITEKIISLRSVNWDSMRPNFFVMMAPKAFDDQPKTFITSIHLDDDQKHVLPSLIKEFPSVTDIDITAIMTQVRDLINKAAFAVQAIFLFTLVAGVVVLFAALQSQKAMRRKEIAILKSLGASRAYLRRSLVLEFAMIGGLAGFLASVLALIAGNVAASMLFDLSPEINLMLITTGTLLGAVLVGAAGYLNVRGLLSVVPVSLFR
ncbi:MAG: FtsX-like permease family protein [Cocleimonas sp.]|nr:FtsX-like permease family protein [Cocleimonas sp.]